MAQFGIDPAPFTLTGTDIPVSPMAWGMWRFAGQGVEKAQHLVETALDNGITLFDTADIYGFGEEGFGKAEELLGQVLGLNPSLRENMVLASKGGITPPVPYDSSRDYLMRALDASLQRLQVDHIDLYQIHRPDILTHPQELAMTLDSMVASGRVRAVGVSNFTMAQIAALKEYLNAPLVTTQPEFSPLHLHPIEDGQLDQAMQHRIAVLAWSPLGGGRLIKPETEREKSVAEALQAIADEQSVSLAAAAMGWLMAHPARVIPIIGSQNPKRIADATKALTMQWTRDQWYDVLVASRGEPLP
ncbi:aldo/keto reductase [Alterisphingorhabdus coralli]|uniref:Aldo/keto reductase n=1 Tax=Alterisphingorhabdus coralli TaxID=3071408 RepID=A0AA97FAI9_9SPHN|nr:aldo/keto reductase [Parasphingorhabdus sp. SCSIO 66989]WOE76596.1 aldo/keto reductase [Parasphingorhabdus sp. SCSIO 66989]